MESVKIVISAKSVLLFFGILSLIWVLYQARDVILLLFASFIIACALIPVVDCLSEKIRRGLAVFIIYFVGFLVILTVLIPSLLILINQSLGFIKELPAYLKEVDKITNHLQIMTQSAKFLPNFAQITKSSHLGENIINQSISLTINAITGLIAAFTLSVLVLYMLLEKNELKSGLLKFFPQELREKTEIILSTISKRVGGYVRGQCLVMLSVGLFTSLGLYIIGVDFAFLLGLIAGLLEIVPIVGPILSAIPAVIVALAKGPWIALWAVLIYFTVHRLENSFITPIILSKFLEMNPLIILCALLFAASTLGLVGVILAPPMAAAIYVIIQELYLKKINPDIA